jgi:hypothetical protein
MTSDCPPQAAAAIRGALSAVREGLGAVPGAGPSAVLSARTPCWGGVTDAPSDRPKRPGQRQHDPRQRTKAPSFKACPLRRPLDCPEWPSASPQPAAPTDETQRPIDEPQRPTDEPQRPADEPQRRADEPRRRCLPAALVLGARGCGAPAFGQRLLSHPDVARAPRGMAPWWTYPSLENFTEHPGMRRAVAGVVAREDGARHGALHGARHGALSAPATALLLVQQSTLDARSAGWGRVLRAKGVELFDLLPRVQASLVNCL